MEYVRCKCTQAVQCFIPGKRTGNTLNLPSPTKLARLGHFPPASQAGRLAGPVFYVYVFSLFPPTAFVLTPDQVDLELLPVGRKTSVEYQALERWFLDSVLV
jgi:hypothetical protein